MEIISGFSKLSKIEKIHWLASHFDQTISSEIEQMKRFWLQNVEEQKKIDEFSENTLTNFIMPFGVAPNVMINNKIYSVPMVIEESSVVAAASLAAKFWLTRGGFKSRVLSTTKVGHVHFIWKGSKEKFISFFESNKKIWLDLLSPLSAQMTARGGGINSLELIDKTSELEFYYQIELKAKTCDAMGANFINTLLEELARLMKSDLHQLNFLGQSESDFDIIMCILSNYTPECLVEAKVDCPISDLGQFSGGLSPEKFAEKFVTAVNIARIDRSRAVTHNKGIMNGVDSVVIATGNDFRAVEACVHAYASRDGSYRSLSQAKIENGHFEFSLTLPLAIGTIGGLTTLHPLSRLSLKILGQPSAEDLMKISSCIGLAQNFGALKSLVTTGIQKGHMKLHLLNILSQFEANDVEKESAKQFFADKVVSYQGVRDFLLASRTSH